MATINLNNDNRNYYLLGGIILAMVIIFTLRRCNRPIPVPQLRIETKVRDSIRTVVEYKDSIRIKYVHKWHTIRHDSLIPCETLVLFCDTIIRIDSSLIASLKAELVHDSIVEAQLYENIRKDTVIIRKLNSRIKNQKLITKVAFITGLASGGLLGYKLTN